MRAPNSIRNVYHRFDEMGLETLTKAWHVNQNPDHYQRSVSTIQKHYKQFTTTGNCFDLSLWLYESFKDEGIPAYFIGEHLGTQDAHVAVIAEDEQGYKYYCDLGDQWIEPILIDQRSDHFSEGLQHRFFPGAGITIQTGPNQFQVTIHRPNGKQSTQAFSLSPIPYEAFMEAAEYSQQLLRGPLVETRFYHEGYDEVVHWEFDGEKSFTSTTQGLIEDPPPQDRGEMITRIHEKTGMEEGIIHEALHTYLNLNTRR